MLRSKHPNRFFGLNPQGIPNQGRKLGTWSRDLPKDWRSAIGADGEDTSTVDADETAGDSATAG